MAQPDQASFVEKASFIAATTLALISTALVFNPLAVEAQTLDNSETQISGNNEIIYSGFDAEGSGGVFCPNLDPQRRVLLTNNHVATGGMLHNITVNGIKEKIDGPKLYGIVKHSSIADLAIISSNERDIKKCTQNNTLPLISSFLTKAQIHYDLITRRNENIKDDSQFKGYDKKEIKVPVTITNVVIIPSNKKLYFLGASSPTQSNHLIQGASGSTGQFSLPTNHYAIAKAFRSKSNRYTSVDSSEVSPLILPCVAILPPHTLVYISTNSDKGVSISDIAKKAGLNKDDLMFGFAPIAKEILAPQYLTDYFAF